MSTITLIMIVLLAIGVIFGVIYGMGRGLNRSILRLILIIGCAAGAIFLHAPVSKAIIEFQIGDATLPEMFVGDVADAKELEMNLIIVGLLIRILTYLILFGLLRLLSWLIVFPIFKIFVRKDLIKKKWWGALVGFVQGLVIAFIVFVPLHGMFVIIDESSKIDMKSNVALEMVKDFGVTEHLNSGFGGVINSIGGWYFEIIMEQK